MHTVLIKIILPLTLINVVACKAPAPKPATLADLFANGQWIDLTYDFSKETIYWPNNPTGFQLDTQFNGTTPAGFYYASNAFASPEHGGTHIDAPVHFARENGHWTRYR